MMTKMIGDDYRDIDDTYNGGIVAPGFGVKTNLQHQPKQTDDFCASVQRCLMFMLLLLLLVRF